MAQLDIYKKAMLAHGMHIDDENIAHVYNPENQKAFEAIVDKVNEDYAPFTFLEETESGCRNVSDIELYMTGSLDSVTEHRLLGAKHSESSVFAPELSDGVASAKHALDKLNNKK